VAEIVFALPGDLTSPTGGYAYARHLLDLLPRERLRVRHLALPGAYPEPTAEDLAQTARLVAGTPSDAVLLIDGLAFGAMPPALVEGFGRPVVALVHHPLGLEHGLAPERREALLASETAALARARRVVVTSEQTRRWLLSDFGVPAGRVTVAEPGTAPAPRAVGTGSPVALLAVGAVSPRKGFDILVAALSSLRDLEWRLTVAGALDRVPACASALRRAIEEADLGGRIDLAGAVDASRLEALYARADIFVSASLLEGYGMVLSEALARGLPLVASTGGAAVDTVPDGAGIKVPPGDCAALAAALRTMIAEPGRRAACAAAAWQAGRALPRWSDTAARVARVLAEAAT
jgi:glycosyltransferase involved in cell wall biosynthesis